MDIRGIAGQCGEAICVCELDHWEGKLLLSHRDGNTGVLPSFMIKFQTGKRWGESLHLTEAEKEFTTKIKSNLWGKCAKKREVRDI